MKLYSQIKFHWKFVPWKQSFTKNVNLFQLIITRNCICKMLEGNRYIDFPNCPNSSYKYWKYYACPKVVYLNSEVFPRDRNKAQARQCTPAYHCSWIRAKIFIYISAISLPLVNSLGLLTKHLKSRKFLKFN